MIKSIQSYQWRLSEHGNRMNTGRIPKQSLLYEPREQRSFIRIMKIWEEIQDRDKSPGLMLDRKV
jgi:hypothetical protein